MSDSPYQRSVDILRKAATPAGFVASLQDTTNYKRVWTRDSVITGMAALLTGDESLIQTFRNGLDTLFSHQHPTGFMPSNVQPDNGKTSYGGTVGRVDNVSWAIIGLCQYHLYTGDDQLSKKYADQVRRGFAVMDAWEFNGRGLMYVPQSGDWADEYIQHGYILYDQLLRLWALELAAIVYRADEWTQRAADIRKIIHLHFRHRDGHAEWYAPNLAHQMETAPREFWLMGFNPARIYPQFDLQANALALLLQIGNAEENRITLDLVDELIHSMQHILPSFHPDIESGDWEMQELKNNYAYHFRNHPHEFHNGGLWPVWNGWMVAALAQQGRLGTAEKLTELIHQANAKAVHGFNECLHGKTLQPSGVQYCTWSAAGAIIAESFIRGKKWPG